MQSAIVRLALGQFTVIIYCVLVVGVLLKVRFGSPAPAIFATLLRDHGFLLLAVPAAWLIWAALSGHRPRVDTGEAGSILLVGLTVLGFLVLLALVGTVSVLSHHHPPVQPAVIDTP